MSTNGQTPLAAQGDLQAVETIVRNAGTSFYRGMRMLPPDRRLTVYAIYAFCRAVDDIADDPAPFADKLARLDEWRGRITNLYLGHADTSVTRVLLAAEQRFHLPQEDFLAVMDGMQMDAESAIVAPDLAALDLYCDRVAAAVGRLSVRAFGDDSEAADRVAHHLGRALQLTNILRDLAEDAARGRLYLPQEWLQDANVPPHPQAALMAPGLAAVCDRVVQLARQHFALAREAMVECDRRAMKPARLMGATYAALLDRIARRGFSRPLDRVSIPKWRKLWIALRYGTA
jgi:presqualene diphosphate synthase